MSYRKPWTTLIANRYRDLWWEFHDLEWTKILQHHLGEFELLPLLDREFSCLTLTNSQDLEGIEELDYSSTRGGISYCCLDGYGR